MEDLVRGCVLILTRFDQPKGSFSPGAVVDAQSHRIVGVLKRGMSELCPLPASWRPETLVQASEE